MIALPFAEAPAAAPALVWQNELISAGALLASAGRAGTRLREAGVRPGDAVALRGANSPAWVVAALGVWIAGGTLVALSTRWTDRETASALAPLQPRVMIDEDAPPGALELSGLGAPGVASLSPIRLAPDAVAVLLFTSGTSGRPKAVELSWKALSGSAEAVSEALSLQAADRWWLAMPLFHVGGLGALLRCGWRGASVALEPRFEPAKAIAAFEAGATIASLVPTMLASVLEILGDRPWPAGLRACMLGGAAVPPALARRCPVALSTYGLSEAGSTVTLVPPGADLATRLSAGYPLGGTSVRVLDAALRPVSPGVEGLIAVAGPGLMRGYRGEDAATAAAFTPDGELLTGDYGKLDAAGRLHIVARREDLIVSGGENVYPAELEAVLLEHPHVASVAVVGAPDARWGARPVAFVKVSGPEWPDLGQFVQGRLARFKQPSRYVRVDELPLLANGKVDRAALRERACADVHALEYQSPAAPSGAGHFESAYDHR